MGKYRVEPEFKDWTIDELQVAITTLEHDLRGSWAEAYDDGGRIQELGRLCESMVHKFERADKQTFVTKLQQGLDFAEMANYDMVVVRGIADKGEFQDGVVFRDCTEFYSLELSERGKTQRVIDWLELNTVCDDFHWFQREIV